jgi:3-oxoacyl-[acyl-carrier protein] reductase
MIPENVPEKARSALLDPTIMVPPLLWLVSPDSDGMTGRRLVATRWRTDLGGREAAEAATDQAGW